MFFSILIPVYNVDRYIRKCVDSVLSQEEQDFEIILCDDGSTDQSGAICDEYVRKYRNKVRVIHKQNEGLLLTRRRAIKEARGEWFVHLDSDDYMMPGTLSAIREAIEKTGADLVVGTYVRGKSDYDDLSDIVALPFKNGEVFTGNSKHNFLMQFLYGGSVTAIWQKVARRDIVDIDADYSPFGFVCMMEDHLQSMPLLQAAREIVFVDHPFTYYRYNENSITKQRNFQSCIKCFQSMREVYKQESAYRRLWNINGADNGKILAKHFRKLCAPLVDVALSAPSTEFKDFVMNIAQDDDLKKDYRGADKREIGRRSAIAFWLAFHNMSFLLRLFCKI